MAEFFIWSFSRPRSPKQWVKYSSITYTLFNQTNISFSGFLDLPEVLGIILNKGPVITHFKEKIGCYFARGDNSSSSVDLNKRSHFNHDTSLL